MVLDLLFLTYQSVRTPSVLLTRKLFRGQKLWRTRSSTAAATTSQSQLKHNHSSSEPVWQEENEAEDKRKDNESKWKEYLRWTPMPLIAFIAYHQYQKLVKLDSPNSLKNLEINCYRMFPWKTFSRTWGWANSIELPLWSRTPFFTWYAKTFGCNIYEAEDDDLSNYKNLGEFFRRGLKQGVRPISYKSDIVSPVDGTVLNFGKIEEGRIEQVKGVTYSLPTFLGPQDWKKGEDSNNNNNNYDSSLLEDPKHNSLYSCVIYLAPGDYHRFHSPAHWNVNFRRHFAGELLSVNPRVAGWISGLFHLNERAVYLGRWKHGFFSMTAVGATNVGSIRVYADNDLMTNCWSVKKNTFRDVEFEEPLLLAKGEDFGEFNLGSTVVLIFEAPSNADFCLCQGTKVKMGEALFETSKVQQQQSH